MTHILVLPYHHRLPLFSSAILRSLVCLLLALSSFGRLLTSECLIGHWASVLRVEFCRSFFTWFLHTRLATPPAGKSCVHCLRALCVASHHGTIVLYHAPVLCCGTVHRDYGCFTDGSPGQDHRASWCLLRVSQLASATRPCFCIWGIVLHLLWLCSLAVWEIRWLASVGTWLLAPCSLFDPVSLLCLAPHTSCVSPAHDRCMKILRTGIAC